MTSFRRLVMGIAEAMAATAGRSDRVYDPTPSHGLATCWCATTTDLGTDWDAAYAKCFCTDALLPLSD